MRAREQDLNDARARIPEGGGKVDALLVNGKRLKAVCDPVTQIVVAELELVEALRTITSRMPNPRPAGPTVWKQLTGITGPTTLPLEFDPGH